MPLNPERDFNIIRPPIYRTNGVIDRIVLSGVHGSGKTTLYKYLCHELGKSKYLHGQGLHEWRPEPVRLIQEYGWPINQEANDESQLAMAAYHMSTSAYPRYIADRCIVDVYVYAKYLNENGDKKVSDSCVKYLEQLVYQFIYNFHGIVFLTITKEDDKIAEDEIRDTDFMFRNGVNALFFMVWGHLLKPERTIERCGRNGQLVLLPDRFHDRVKIAMNQICLELDPYFRRLRSEGRVS